MKEHCRMEDVIMKDLINTAICRLRIGILQKESLQTLYTINAPLRLYNTTLVRQLAQQNLKVDVYRPIAQKVLDKLDHLEAERAELMASKNLKMEDQVEPKKESVIIDVITLDDDEGDRKKELEKEKARERAAKRKSKREERKQRLAEEAARKKKEEKEAVKRKQAERKKLQNALFRDSSPPAPTKNKIVPEIPKYWNQTMYNMERCYEKHVFEEFRHRILDKTGEETWTAFYKRIFKEEMSPPPPAPEFRQPILPQDSQYSGHQADLPVSARRSAAPPAGKLDVFSAPTMAVTSNQADTDRVPACRIPQHLWPDFNNMK